MEENSALQSKIESILFVASKPLSANTIAKILGTDISQIETSLLSLADAKKDSGTVLLESNGTWQVATNPENAANVKTFLNTELRERLTDVTVETLAIIAYRQPISKAEIEAIRGVNCQYSIRTLLMRGLIARSVDQNDGRQVLYQTTHKFLEHMGLGSVKDLPDFDALVAKITLAVPEAPAEPAEQPQ